MIENKQSNFLLYKGSNGNINIDVLLEHETVWLSKKSMGSDSIDFPILVQA